LVGDHEIETIGFYFEKLKRFDGAGSRNDRVDRPLTASKSVRTFTECEHAQISIFAWYVGKMSTYHAK
jgi:hypothetical protein